MTASREKSLAWAYDGAAHLRALTAVLAGLIVVAASGAVVALGDTLFPAESLAAGVRADFDATAHFIDVAVTGRYDTRDTIGRPMRGWFGSLGARARADASGDELSGLTLDGRVGLFLPVIGDHRTVMFGLPPGRMERREHHGDELPDRPLSASVAKARLVAVIRDFAIEDREFAVLAVPVLEAFARSEGKGERHGCVAALAGIRRAHPGLPVDLPAGLIPVRTNRRPRLGA